MTEQHEVVDVVAGLKKKTAHGRVGDDVFRQDDRPHVKLYKFLNVFHLLVQW